MDELLIPMLILQWIVPISKTAIGIGLGLYLGQWLWAGYTPRKRRR